MFFSGCTSKAKGDDRFDGGFLVCQKVLKTEPGAVGGGGGGFVTQGKLQRILYAHKPGSLDPKGGLGGLLAPYGLHQLGQKSLINIPS